MSYGDYLSKRHNTFYVTVEVPKSLRTLAGRDRFIKSLKTTNQATANSRKHAVVALFKAKIEDLRRAQGDPKALAISEAQEWREMLSASSQWPEENNQGASEKEILEAAIDQRADQLEESVRDVFLANAFTKGVLIRDHAETWATEADVVEQTRSQHRNAVKRFLEWSGSATTIEATTRLKAGSYVSYLIASSGLSRSTIKRHISSLSQLWEWFESKGLIDPEKQFANIWHRHKLGKKQKKVTRTALDDDQLVKLLEGRSTSPKYSSAIADLLRLALLTGARLDELCELKQSDVDKREDGYWISISDGKNENAIRDIPLNTLADAIIDRRLASKASYLFHELEPGGPDNKRGWHVSKAYGRFRAQADVGVSDRWQDFHALRHTFTSMMEGQEVPESTVKLLVGHARTSMTFGLYSKGKRVELRNSIERIDYGTKVMRALG